MKFSFKIQQYQTDAVDAVARVFQGQPYNAGVSYLRDMGNLSAQPQQLSLVSSGDDATQVELQDLINDSGFKNEALQLTDQELLQNIRTLQAEANIHQSDKLVAPLGRCSLDIEMETGTGKTYVYIKTMFELNKRYGWSKFIVVVPSIAIREGVKKSFEITTDHFMECYGKKARFFIYNSSNLNQLDSFSSNSGINVMIINTQAFAASMNEDKNVEGRKGDAAARIIYTKRDEFGSRRPIDVIAANRPILILDEPQKMGKEDSATQKALKKFNPLFTLNYSATHAKQHNLIYVLDALDAYNKRLVKKIEVKGFEVKNLRGTDKCLYLESIIISPKNPPRAKVEMEVSHQNGTKREFHMLDVGDNLYYKSGEMEQYKGFVVSEIDPITGVVTFTNGDTIRKGDVTGDVSENDMRRVQIHETILSHFEKEQDLFKLGIKTLSLFFIDEVAKYRQYDEDGNELLGEYGKIFEQEYLSVLNEHRTLFDPAYTAYLDSTDVHDVHKGYFSIDKKGHSVNSSVKRGSDMSDDISAYDLILKNKERLLSFDKHIAAIEKETEEKSGSLVREETHDRLRLADVTISVPAMDENKRTREIISSASCTIKSGEHVILKGPSGSGKSTLLRTLAGFWPYVKGHISMPAPSEMMFIPQKPYIPMGTSAEAASYPLETADEEILSPLLVECGLSHLMEKTDTEADWSHILSLGEQQKLAFVRVFLRKPKWVFLDEATSAMDEETEEKMYRLLTALPGTTVISIGHRSTLDKWHDRVLRITNGKLIG